MIYNFACIYKIPHCVHGRTNYMHMIIRQWHIFIILIGVCTNLIVAPGNLSIIPSVDLQVYNNLLKFSKRLHIYIMSYDALKSWFSHTFSIVEDMVAHHNTKLMGKP